MQTISEPIGRKREIGMAAGGAVWCAKCEKAVRDCDCPDIDERLEFLRVKGLMVYVMCETCHRHIDRCICTSKGRAILTTDN